MNENVFSRTALTVSFSIKPKIASFRPDFCCNFGNLGKNNVFCGKIANTHPTKELKAFFAFAESLPTSATLKSSIFLKQTCEFNSLACSKFYTYNQVHFVCIQSRYKYLATSAKGRRNHFAAEKISYKCLGNVWPGGFKCYFLYLGFYKDNCSICI